MEKDSVLYCLFWVGFSLVKFFYWFQNVNEFIGEVVHLDFIEGYAKIVKAWLIC